MQPAQILNGNLNKRRPAPSGRRFLIISLLCFFLTGAMFAVEPNEDWTCREIRRFPAVEAKQGVAVDGEFFYAITNRQIGKYQKSDGKRVGGWKDAKGGEFIHLNSGFVRDGMLVGSHSNFPGVPMFSSVEIFDTKTMRPVSSHSLGIGPGSLTWIAERDGLRYACFANYAGATGTPGRDPAYTQVVCYDGQWRAVGGFGFPKELVKLFNNSSSSCGAFGPGGFLYITGHDARELYVLDFPKAGSTFRWLATIPIPMPGQAFAWDPSDEKILYGIDRKSKEVIVVEIKIPAP
jgi:hypothetical protein